MEIIILSRNQTTRTTPDTPPENLHPTPTRVRLTPTDLMPARFAYMANLSWNQVSNLRASGPKADTLGKTSKDRTEIITYKRERDFLTHHRISPTTGTRNLKSGRWLFFG
ncbi:hypothetical protein AVEN_268873-1 [Araneus ventricosus]|uniref:Uncharacterized protein n=1 Tax=Araneus ventricosus TaxID=182803 RepID=A0A4Y2EY51_ARAVE|nr:hypothetical protein AVEN_268873-1 [Araneus ventricosus]